MINRLIFFGFLFFLGSTGFAQYTQIGQGGFKSASYGPIAPNLAPQYYSRYAYIYPANSFSNLQHNDSITAIAFKHAPSIPLTGTTTLQIYLKTTSQSQFGSSALNWKAESRNGMVKVFDGSPNSLIQTKQGYAIIRFNQVNAFHFDTTGGAIHLEMLIEYTQQTSQSSIDWYCESSLTVPAFVSSNETKFVRGSGAMDSICSSNSSIKPTLKLYYPRDSVDLKALKIQCFVNKPVLMGQSDSIKVLIQNLGKTAVKESNVFLNVTGASNHTDTLVIDSIASLEVKELVFSKHNAVKVGEESLTVSLTGDDNSTNNTVNLKRNVSYSKYGYTKQSQTPRVIGFDNQRGALVGKYYCNASNKLDHVEVAFNLPGKRFQLVVYKEQTNSDLPGVLLYASDTLYSVQGINHIALTSSVFVNGNFFVGVRQVDSFNFSLSAASEQPLISRTFYYLRPTEDSVWTDLTDWSDVRIAVYPAIVAGNDLVVNSITIPSSNDTFTYSKTDSIKIEASVTNLGYLPQNNFNVRVDIFNRFNQIVFSSTRKISLASGDTAYLTFDKLSLDRFGTFRAQVTSLSIFDLYNENSVLDSIFYIVKEHDFSANYIFEPLLSDTFEVNKEGFWPRARVFNYGSNEEKDVSVFVQLVQEEAVLYEDTLAVSLKAEFSKIVSFDSITPRDIGDLEFRVFTLLDTDSFPENDTIRTFIFGRASDDLEVDSFINPGFHQKFKVDSSFSPQVRVVNNGVYDRLTVLVHTKIYNLKDVEVYHDSAAITVGSFSTNDLTFSSFNCDVLGDYTIKTYLHFNGDQYAKNDTLISYFKVVEDYDLKLVQLIQPIPNQYYLINSTSVYPQVELFNNGKNAIDSALLDIKIENEMGIIYHDSISVSLAIDEQKTVYFNSQIVLDEIGDFKVRLVNKWDGEQSPTYNDTLFEEYYIRYNYDVAIDSHATPQNGGIFELSQPVNPKISIRNSGMTRANNIAIEIEVLRGNTVKLKDTLFLPRLNYLKSINLQSTQFLKADSVGVYTLISRLLNGDDDVRNDTFMSTFTLVKSADIKMDSIVFPKEGAELVTNQKYEPTAWIKNDGLTDFDLLSVVAQVFIEDTLFYTNSKALNLSSGDAVLVRFDSVLFALPSANASILIYVVAQGDNYNYNDSLIHHFTIEEGANVSQLNALSLRVYPNPFQKHLTVESAFPIDRIRVYSMLGKLEFECSPKTMSYTLTKELSENYYILEVQSNFSQSRRLIVRYEE